MEVFQHNPLVAEVGWGLGTGSFWVEAVTVPNVPNVRYGNFRGLYLDEYLNPPAAAQ